MGLHHCYMRDGAAIPCICSVNQDHHEEEFDLGPEESFEEVFDDGDTDLGLALGDPTLGEEDDS